VSVVEQSFPTRCPNCKMSSAVTAQPHCPSLTCPWQQCICGAVFNKAGCIMPKEVAP